MAAPYRPPDFHTFFLQFPVGLHQPAVHAVHDRAWVALLLHRVVEGFRFRLGHPVAVIVTGRSPDQVVPVCLVDTLGHDFRVEDDGREQVAKFLGRLSFFEWKLVRRDVPHGFPEEGLAESRFELLATVMVVYAVGEPYALQVDGEFLEVLAVPVT